MAKRGAKNIIKAPAKVHLTREGLKEIKQELDGLVNNKRPESVERVARARDFGDLSENNEYQQARDELSFIDGKIEELQNIISKALVVGSKKNRNTIDIGCKVTLSGNGKNHTYTIVGEWEADPKEKKISHESPLGKALVGRKVGEEVEVEVPAGKILYMVKKIH
jgi:transcription elongation factor GreA